MVCVERTVSSEIILDDLREVQGDMGQVESRSSLFGDNIRVSAR
jgi:hypothetical protein